MNVNNHICDTKHAWVLDNGLRRFLQSPHQIISDYIKPGMHVLDIGCGPGYFTIPMALKVGKKGQVTAIDVQANMLVNIRKKIESTKLEDNIKLHLCSDTSLNINGEFDFAMSFWMVHEVPSPKNLILEVYSNLSNQGKWLVVEPKGHVSKDQFKNTIDMAVKHGFIVENMPDIKFSRAALLRKNYLVS